MNIKPNIGMLNALIRITFGFTILAWSTAKLVKHPWRDSYLFAAFCGAMKVAEGIVRYCPVTALCERCSDMIQEHNQATDSMDGMEGLDTDAIVPYNPS
ncbi:DUF2892 domain-containing protein [Neobacillus sp. MM2021_6]|uniref:YgaP family membrane protein n=1 Tax=Bacillaceae TaxID=186817 RepID=UPI001407E9D6|nr:MULTISPECIES: DUF2892 domain-containing protein [Bacillaceae]MBO0959265.1 DUF2892 domain-containing protein [Neobacillus sp. MM2021_6]NHC20937.1 DUF2892 domain-containing protein [Bacillus sp. MM2020_4]WML42185.1 DUF2892 domain-containing protein [Neobacillus sp. OS1-2]